MNKKNILYASIIVLVTFGIYYGFDKHESRIKGCSTEFEAYALANYSSTESGIDYDGDFYSETDYWTEVVSETYEVFTKDGVLTEYNCPYSAINKYTCITPPISIPHDKGYDFDNYISTRNLRCYVYFETGGYNSVSLKKHEEALKNIGSVVEIKTWYGKEYSYKLIN